MGAAVGAGVAPEMPHVDGLVAIGVPTAPAMLGVRRVRHSGLSDAVVLDAEVQDPVSIAAEIGDERVIRVEGQCQARIAVQHRGPAIGDRLELPVAVELIAEGLPA